MADKDRTAAAAISAPDKGARRLLGDLAALAGVLVFGLGSIALILVAHAVLSPDRLGASAAFAAASIASMFVSYLCARPYRPGRWEKRFGAPGG